MDRWGCVDVPALPLQLLLRRHPAWTRHPVAVVDEDRPQGTILWANERALRCKVWPGRRYAEGLALAAELRAGVVAAAEIEAAVEELLQRLRAFTPEVEPCSREPGLFWLNATGIEGAFPSLPAWARGIVHRLREAQLSAAAVVGFTRFGTFALARSERGVRVVASAAEERRLSDLVPLHRLGLDPKLRDALHALGVEDVGAFRRLPPGGLRERFGAEAHALHRLAHGAGIEMLAPAPEIPPVGTRLDFEPDQHRIDVPGLMLLLAQRLAHIARILVQQDQAIAALRLRLLHEKRTAREERVCPAAPTLDQAQLAELLRLRLSSLRLDDELTGFELYAEVVPAAKQQLSLFRAAPKRDLAAGNRALARLRAELGASAVVQAVLRDGHLPEARYAWQPLPELQSPRPAVASDPVLVRRFLARPLALASPPGGTRPDGWFVRGLASGPVYGLSGPHVISGGWWQHEQHREYYFAETRRGDLLWIYFDRRRRRWFLHGEVV